MRTRSVVIWLVLLVGAALATPGGAIGGRVGSPGVHPNGWPSTSAPGAATVADDTMALLVPAERVTERLSPRWSMWPLVALLVAAIAVAASAWATTALTTRGTRLDERAHPGAGARAPPAVT